MLGQEGGKLGHYLDRCRINAQLFSSFTKSTLHIICIFKVSLAAWQAHLTCSANSCDKDVRDFQSLQNSMLCQGLVSKTYLQFTFMGRQIGRPLSQQNSHNSFCILQVKHAAC